MPAPSQPLPTVGQSNSTEDPKSRAALLELQQLLTQSLTGLDGDNLSAALAQRLGLSDSLATRRGKSIIAAAGTRTNAAYGALDNGPDRVQSIVLPTDGLIFVAFQGMWKESFASAASAALFLGATQLQNARSSAGSPIVQETQHGSVAGVNAYTSMSTKPAGLAGDSGSGIYLGDVTTGQTVGRLAPGSVDNFGFCTIFAAAGTYDVSVQFKASGGATVTAQNRKLWCWSLGF